jgi:NAD(P)-dependent dehydrogenase (short-subunit alcohol dehydrogenase family)
MFDLAGHGSVVTGGASGIGLACAEALAENGARVTIFDVNRVKIDREVARLKEQGLDVRGVFVDVCDHSGLQQAMDDTRAFYGRLDVVFANAGIDPGPGFIGPDGSRPPQFAIENYGDDRWNKVIDVNLDGIFATIRAAAGHLKAQRSGRIIVTTSIAAFRPTGFIGAAYMAAKAGAAQLMRNAAYELAKYRVTVNAIAPALIVTDIGGGWLKDPAHVQRVAATIPIGRIGQPEDIKGIALLLASRASSYMTGCEIPIDGGCALGPAF